MSEPVRAWIYRALVAAMPLLVLYGAVDDQAAGVWIAAAGGILGVGLAAANTSTGGK